MTTSYHLIHLSLQIALAMTQVFFFWGELLYVIRLVITNFRSFSYTCFTKCSVETSYCLNFATYLICVNRDPEVKNFKWFWLHHFHMELWRHIHYLFTDILHVVTWFWKMLCEIFVHVTCRLCFRQLLLTIHMTFSTYNFDVVRLQKTGSFKTINWSKWHDALKGIFCNICRQLVRLWQSWCIIFLWLVLCGSCFNLQCCI